MTGGSAPHVHWHPPRRGVWWPLWAFAWLVLRPTSGLVLGFRATGRENIPRRGGVLVVANHVADIDPPAVGLACAPRPAQFIAMARHFTRRPFAYLLFGLGAFPIDTGRGDTRALRHARTQLELGRLVVIFPEGSPTWGGGLAGFHEGVGHLALTPGVTVVPMALWGTQNVLRGWRPVGRGPVHVSVGRPVPVPPEGSRRERGAALTTAVRSAIEEMLEPMVRAHP